MPVRTKPTRELFARILANYRQTGDLTNAAIRSGISRSTIHAWKARGEKAKSGLLADFAQNLELVLKDENGNVVFEDVVMLPNRQALETRLRWMAPDRFPARSAKTEPAN